MTGRFESERTVSCMLFDGERKEDREYSVSMNSMKKEIETAVIVAPEGELDVPISDLPYLIKTLKEFLILQTT